jgi:hypothetical protein
VVWHALALVIVPLPDSVVKQSLARVLDPYVVLLRIANTWDFYAPNVGNGQRLRFVVEDATGRHYPFTPTEPYGWLDPRYWWLSAWHNEIISDPDANADLAAQLLCKEKASLSPVSITLIQILQKDFSPEDYLAGKRPMDPEFIEENILKRVRCPGK